MGDNITPPQQAFNWISDIYSRTEEIKANGQTIVGLIHEDIGHLGIFVSGKVAKKEHTQIISVLKYIQELPPGLYGMEIHETVGADGTVEYDVTLHERKLEDLKRLQKYDRVDEKPFEAVAALSELTERAYELLVRPAVREATPEWLAKVLRTAGRTGGSYARSVSSDSAATASNGFSADAIVFLRPLEVFSLRSCSVDVVLDLAVLASALDDLHAVKAGRQPLDEVEHRHDLRVLLLRHLAGHEDAEMPDVLMHAGRRSPGRAP